MKLGYTVFATLIFLVLALIFFAAGNRANEVFAGLGGIFSIIFAPLLFYLVMVVVTLICDGQFAKKRPAPDLPIIFYTPDLPTCLFLFLGGAFFLTPGYFVAQSYSARPIYFTENFFVLTISISLGAFLIFWGLWRVFKKRILAEVTPAGISSKYFTCSSWNFPKRTEFISWQEIAQINADALGPGKLPNRVVYIRLKNDDVYQLSASIYKVHLKEVKAWLQEYLSRYGSNAKPAV